MDLAGSMSGFAENGPHNAIPMLPTRTGVFLFCATLVLKSAVCISIYCIIVIFLDSNSAQTGHPIPLEGISSKACSKKSVCVSNALVIPKSCSCCGIFACWGSLSTVPLAFDCSEEHVLPPNAGSLLAHQVPGSDLHCRLLYLLLQQQ